MGCWSKSPCVCGHYRVGGMRIGYPSRVEEPKSGTPGENVARVGLWPTLANEVASWGCFGR